jgi:lambda family phage portal protein
MTSNAGPNASLDGAAPQLRAQSRDLMRKNALAASGRERLVSNMVGTGIKPKIADAELAATWTTWTDQADAAGVLDFYGVERLVASSLVEAGEVFVRMRNRLPADGLVVPLQLEILEADFVPHDKNEILASGNAVRQGIEFDRVLRSKRVAYWVYPRHPDDGGNETSINEAVRVPASEICHIFEPIRPGQIRGEPWLTRVIARLKDLDTYDEAELVRKKVAAMFAGFIRRALPDGMTVDDLREVWGADASVDANGVGDVALDDLGDAGLRDLPDDELQAQRRAYYVKGAG